ncbi:hypothetical protein EDC01DRAFT_715175 [Geopyxis carbonaria]|nr:hypothetical protein EDC01DRAFT_715175 [Geopyxis carbonaria]
MSSSKFPDQYSLLTNNNLTKDVTIFVGIVVSGVLNVEILESKAQELVTEWPLLGGKLVTKTVPYSFTTGDALDFKHRSIDLALEEFSPISFLDVEKTQDRPSYRDFSSGSSGDELFHFESLKPLNLTVDTLFTLRVTLLKDATLLGFRMPHQLCDGQSVYDVVKAYSHLIAGKPISRIVLPPDVKTPLSALVEGSDSLPENVRKNAPFVHPAENFAVGVSPLVKYIGHALLGVASAKIGWGEGERERYIHLPGELVQTWRRECQEELDKAALSGGLGDGAGLELTKNDVITAWFLKCAYHKTPADDGPVDLMYNFNYRPALKAPEADTTYLHNSYYNIRTNWPSLREFKEASLARVALAVRLSVVRNKQPSAVRNTLEFWEENIANTIAPGPPGCRLSFLPFFSAWTTFEYNGMDFSAALINKTEQDSSNMQGKVIFTHPYAALPMGMTVKPFAISLKDGRGGYWLRSNVLKSGWEGYA